MSRKKVESKGALRLSYSSMNLLKGCSQKYYYYKVAQEEKDPDVKDDSTALNIGSAFHYILEHNKHSYDRINELVLEACREYEVEHKQGLIHAMVLKYLKLHKEQGLHCIYAELEIEDDTYLGYVDAIMVDPQGGWWIVDLKTAGRFGELTYQGMAQNVQLNMYAAYYELIAQALDLDPDNFAGVRYRATTKSVSRQTKSESYRKYVTRLYNAINSYDVVVPMEYLSPGEAAEEHAHYHRKAKRIHSGEEEPRKNYGFCDTYFKPCEWWSKCHGHLFTESNPEVEVFAV